MTLKCMLRIQWNLLEGCENYTQWVQDEFTKPSCIPVYAQ